MLLMNIRDVIVYLLLILCLFFFCFEHPTFAAVVTHIFVIILIMLIW